MAIITKWWYAIPLDAPDTLFYGFPFPFVGEGWHTSLSLQFFIIEFVIDFFMYFLVWFAFFFLANRVLRQPAILNKRFTLMNWIIAGVVILIASFITAEPNNIYYTHRPYEMEILDAGYQFVWQNKKRPDYYHYKPKADTLRQAE